MNRKISLLVGLIINFSFAFAQELSVKSMREATQDLSARTIPCMDLNNVECALVKVQIVGEGVMFSGNVMGDVKYKGNEYWVYMPNGSKRLKVTHPDCLPLEISFDNYGISRLRSKTTYVLTLTKEQPVTPIIEKSKTGYISILSDRKLLPNDLANKTKKELEILRNMIYARYGYRFKRDDLFNYFSQFAWYKPTTSDASVAYNRMSSIEHYNIDLIKKYEK